MARRPLAVEFLEGRLVPTAWQELPIVPDFDPDTLANVRAIYQRGQLLGNRPDVFMKVGDSLSAYPNSYPALASPAAALTVNTYHPELADTLAAYLSPASGATNSFNRASLSAVAGFSTGNTLATAASEIATIRPAVAVIQIGTNDLKTLGGSAELYRPQLRELVRQVIAAGVVPVLTILPTSAVNGFSFEPSLAGFNEVITDTADEFDVPVWNLRAALRSSPTQGLGADGLHMSYAPTGGGDLSPGALGYGDNAHNLGLLQTLDRVREALRDPSFGRAAPDDPWQPLQPGTEYVAVTATNSLRVVVTDAGGNTINAFNSFSHGGDAAVGDVNGDGVPDVVLSAGRGAAPVVQARDGRDGSVLWQFFAFDSSFKGGVEVEVGNFDSDAAADLVVGAGFDGGPIVRTVRGIDQSTIATFAAYEPSFRGGVHVATADRDGDGIDEVITGAGRGGAPVVKVFTADGTDREAFFAYESELRSGVYVAGGDVDGDGRDEVLTGPGGEGPRVQAFALGTTEPVRNFFAGDGNSGARLKLVRDGATPVLWASVGRGTTIKRWSLNVVTPLEDLFIPIADGTRALV